MTNKRNKLAVVETYDLKRADDTYIRRATLVRFDDYVVRFVEKLPKREAIKQALKAIERNPEYFRSK